MTAPGGDSLFGRTTEAPNGRVLSSYSSAATRPCRADRSIVEPNEPTAVYCYLQGTSMASPHAAGVAALIISRYGDLDNPQNGKMRPGAVAAYMQQTADPQPCPTQTTTGLFGLTFGDFPRPDGSPQECQGGEGYNSWYGSGQINALSAITR